MSEYYLCDNQNDLKEKVVKLTEQVLIIESIFADRITDLEKIVIELDDRIRKLEWLRDHD